MGTSRHANSDEPAKLYHALRRYIRPTTKLDTPTSSNTLNLTFLHSQVSKTSKHNTTQAQKTEESKRHLKTHTFDLPIPIRPSNKTHPVRKQPRTQLPRQEKNNPRRQQCSAKQTNRQEHPQVHHKDNKTTLERKRRRLRKTTIWAARPRGFSIPLILRRKCRPPLPLPPPLTSRHQGTTPPSVQEEKKNKRLVHKKEIE